MARLKNSVLDASIVVLVATVVLGERVLFPLLKAAVAMLESLVTSLEATSSPLPQLEVPMKEFELVEAIQPVEVKEAIAIR